MKIHMRGAIWALLLLLVLGAFWQFSRINGGDGIVTGKSWMGKVNEGKIEIASEAKAQWEAQLAVAKASYLAGEKKDMGVLQNIAVLNQSLGHYAAAREAIEMLLEQNKINDGAWVIAGDIAQNMEDWNAAEKNYLKAIELGGLNQQLLTKVEQLWRTQFPKKIEKIKGLYEAAIAYDGQKKFYLIGLGRWYAEQGNFVEAASHLKVALTLDPKNEDLKKEWMDYEQKAGN